MSEPSVIEQIRARVRSQAQAVVRELASSGVSASVSFRDTKTGISVMVDTVEDTDEADVIDPAAIEEDALDSGFSDEQSDDG